MMQKGSAIRSTTCYVGRFYDEIEVNVVTVEYAAEWLELCGLG